VRRGHAGEAPVPSEPGDPHRSLLGAIGLLRVRRPAAAVVGEEDGRRGRGRRRRGRRARSVPRSPGVAIGAVGLPPREEPAPGARRPAEASNAPQRHPRRPPGAAPRAAVGALEHGLGGERVVRGYLQPRRQLERHEARPCVVAFAAVRGRGDRGAVRGVGRRRQVLGPPGRVLPEERHRDGRAERRRGRRPRGGAVPGCRRRPRPHADEGQRLVAAATRLLRSHARSTTMGRLR
jgi:hypothetical protein